MKKIFNVFFIAATFLIAACGGNHQAAPANNETNAAGNGKKIIVDVRSVEEWNNDGHADCAVNIPIDQFASHIDELKAYSEVVLVCRSGGRAGNALEQMEEAGYSAASNLGAWTNIKCE